ncbi:MAG: PQQ-binding-like beta-propeller repeat protein [Vicinamibacterales bacterium]|nr:PQQ-binding-like beta-propeller repeat protein [Vicinamibacterales bacterium]
MSRNAPHLPIAALKGLATAAVALVLSTASPADAQDRQEMTGEWRVFAGDQASTKYSGLDQISADNVGDLRPGWIWDAAALDAATGERPRGFRATPLKIGNRLYVSTALNQVAALDPGTGTLVWSYDPKAYAFETPTHGGLGSRGVSYWSDGAGNDRIVFATGGMQLFTLEPETGALDRDFGDDGIVDLTKGLGREIAREHYNMKSPPTICGDTIVLGSIVNDLGLTRQMPPGHVRGYDVRTGAMKWIFHTIPQEGEPGVETWENGSWRYTGNTNVWSWMSCDEDLGHV